MALINTTTTGVLGTTLYGDGQGSLTVQKDGVTIGKVAENQTFWVYQSTAQTLTNNSWTKVALQSIYFNVGNAFNTSTYRYQPTVAGYYQLNGTVQAQMFAALGIAFWKNGAGLDYGVGLGTSGQLYATTSQSKIVYLNGTTDYIEMMYYQSTGSSVTTVTVDCTFSGTLVRAE